MLTSIIVTDLEGHQVDLLQKYEAKPLVLVIYNNKCLGCTGRAIPLAYEFQQENEAIQVVGIHSCFGGEEITKEDIKSIFTSGEEAFPIYLDKDHSVYDQFQAEGTPQWILITREGNLYRSIFGSQEGAHNRLLYALEGLVNGEEN
jgi:peroxiredoxin